MAMSLATGRHTSAGKLAQFGFAEFSTSDGTNCRRWCLSLEIQCEIRPNRARPGRASSAVSQLREFEVPRDTLTVLRPRRIGFGRTTWVVRLQLQGAWYSDPWGVEGHERQHYPSQKIPGCLLPGMISWLDQVLWAFDERLASLVLGEIFRAAYSV